MMRNAAFRMNGFSVDSWHDGLDIGRLRMEIVEVFEVCISDNAMQRKRGRENLGKSSNDSEKSASKGLEYISTKAAADEETIGD
jgi:hypothetical protein